MKAFIVILALVLSPVVSSTDTSSVDRPDIWARPVRMEGVPNLHKVSDTLYRSAQPTALGMKNLKAMGIRTIINLRSFHSDRDEIEDTGLGYEHIYMKAWHPEEKESVQFLRIFADPERLPALVHCQHGADRTGSMSSVYRIAMQGWTKDDAIREMTRGGCGFHSIWRNLPGWIRKLDMDMIQEKAGIKK